MNNHGNRTLTIAGVSPQVKYLHNDRYRLTFRLGLGNNSVGWYYENRDNIFSDFGRLSETTFSKNVENETSAPSSQTWPDACLVRQELAGEDVTELYLTYEKLTDSFVEEIEEVVDYDLNGLRRVTRQLIALSGTPYGKEVGVDSIDHEALGYGEETLYLGNVQEVPKQDGEDGFIRIREVWLQPGVISESTRTENGGLITKSITSWYDKPLITGGAVESTVQENIEGFDVWTVTAKLRADGGGLTDGTAQEYEGYFMFEYPGVASIYENDEDYPGVNVKFLGVQLDPPITVPILATVSVSYFTGSTAPSLNFTLWAPNSWAKVDATWINTSDSPRSKQEGLRGYRTGPDSIVNYTSTASRLGAPFGEFVPVGNTTKITVSGGPVNPSGSFYTINTPKAEYAFSDENGVDYYRWVVVSAFIP